MNIGHDNRIGPFIQYLLFIGVEKLWHSIYNDIYPYSSNIDKFGLNLGVGSSVLIRDRGQIKIDPEISKWYITDQELVPEVQVRGFVSMDNNGYKIKIRDGKLSSEFKDISSLRYTIGRMEPTFVTGRNNQINSGLVLGSLWIQSDAPITAYARIVVFSSLKSEFLLTGRRSFVKVAFGPIKTSCAIEIPFHKATPFLRVVRSPILTSPST